MAISAVAKIYMSEDEKAEVGQGSAIGLPNFKADADNVRAILKDAAVKVYALIGHDFFAHDMAAKTPANIGEMKANIMLAFRAIEDSAMRVGKSIQAYTGGESPLGGPNTPEKK